MTKRDTWSRRGILGLPVALALAHPLLAVANDQQPPNLNELPANLPRPKDDGGARHLKGMAIPDLELPSTSNRLVNLSRISAPRIVIYAYPPRGAVVFYPVFPPDRHADEVIAWLRRHALLKHI